MKGYAMLKIGESGWIEKPKPEFGPLDAICKPLAVAICTSDVHTLWEGAIGERHNMILGHECCAEVVEVGSLVKDFKPGDRVLVPAITPDWNSLEAQPDIPCTPAVCWQAGNSPTLRTAYSANISMSTTQTETWRCSPKILLLWTHACFPTWFLRASTA